MFAFSASNFEDQSDKKLLFL